MKSEESILSDALEKPASDRSAFLARACGNDVALRERIQALLRGYEGAGAKLEDSPFAGPAKTARASGNTGLHDYAAGMRIGRYKLLQKLGEGGCGVVFMAEQEEPIRRRVALKVIKLGMDTREVIARFEAERQALALMDHPNIAHVLDAGATENGRPFFVMELVRGVPITRHCDEHQLGAAERVQLFIQVCSAVQHAHQKGIIHRDLKPTNILVTLHDGVPMPKIIDFGIAKAMHGRLTDHTLFTAFEQFVGTPAYMSPEQMEMSGLDVDTRSDVYSLGVLLYELLTGRPPFESKALLQIGLDAMRRTIREKEPPKPSTRVSTLDAADGASVARQRRTDLAKLRSWLRGDIDWIVMRCLEKDRTRRYETASGLAMDLQRYLRNEPVIARPPRTAYVLHKLIRRHKLAVSTAAIVLLTLVAGLALATQSWVRERAARQRADSEAARSAQVARFMQDMLAGVGPEAALGRDTKLLRTILDHTVLRMNQQLRGQPEVEAGLRQTLGQVYRDLGELSAAALMQERALQLRRELFGPAHAMVADSLHELGDIRTRQGRLSEAETLLRDALAMREKLLGADHAASAATRAALVHVRRLARLPAEVAFPPDSEGPPTSEPQTSRDKLTPANPAGPRAAKPEVIRISLGGGGMIDGKPVSANVLAVVWQRRALENEFSADGIRVEWSFHSNVRATQEIHSRALSDFSAVGAATATHLRATGVVYEAIVALRRFYGHLCLVVRADSPIRTVADLKGKRLVIGKGFERHVTLCRILEEHGLAERDFDIQYLDGPAAVRTLWASGSADGRLVDMDDPLDRDAAGNVRVIHDPGREFDSIGVSQFLVWKEFERRHPDIVQRVVTTIVKTAAWACDERNREQVLQSWSTSPEHHEHLASTYATHSLKARLSPLMDDSFVAGLRRDSEDAKRFGLVSDHAATNPEGWFNPKYLNHALREANLENFWPTRDSAGKFKGVILDESDATSKRGRRQQ